MANHKSSKKRIRQDAKRRIHNRYYKKITRTAIRKISDMENKEEAAAFAPKVYSMIDRLAKRNIWHDNKAANQKSKITKRINAIAS